MHNKLEKILPWTVLLGAVLVFFALIINRGMRFQMLSNTGETTRVVDSALAEFERITPSNAQDPALGAAVERLRTAPYVASAWLFDPQGKVLFSEGSTAFKDHMQERVTNETKRILSSLPVDTLTDEQALLLSAASAIQAEGEHNDVYLHRVRPLRNAAGKLVAIVGIAYDVSAGVSTPGAAWTASLVVFIIGLGLYWLSLPAWTYLDARRIGEPAWVWAMFVLLGNAIAMMAYLLVKSTPKRPPLK